jgi:hypothetical protein
MQHACGGGWLAIINGRSRDIAQGIQLLRDVPGQEDLIELFFSTL